MRESTQVQVPFAGSALREKRRTQYKRIQKSSGRMTLSQQIAKFNEKPKRGIEQLQAAGLLPKSLEPQQTRS